MADESFERFAYRLIYMRPSHYSDERITVGIVAEVEGRLETRFLSSVDSLALMAELFGEDGVEQFQFSVGEFRRVLSRCKTVESVVMPTDLFAIGESVNAFTRDRVGLLTSVLASAACLVRTGPRRAGEVVARSRASSLPRELLNYVSRLNPLVAQDLFDKKVVVEGKSVELPIYGTKIFGAPVSFATHHLSVSAESYIARFAWLRKYLTRQQPRLYVLAPQQGSVEARSRLESSVRELSAIAEASSVPVKTSRSTEEMAALIVREEAA